MKPAYATVCIGILAGSIVFAVGADREPQKISADDLQSGRAVILGALGSPLGTFMRVEGAVKENLRKEDDGPLVAVDTVNGLALKSPVVVEVRSLGEALRPKAGTRLALRGFEWGGMEGYPVDPDLPRADTVEAVPQSIAPDFHVWFQVRESPPAGAK